MTFPVDLLRKCWFLAGPTASGKTAVSLSLADNINAEIVALDSMTLYRGMDIGTAKPTTEERSRVRHHLIDILDPHEEFSVAAYLAAAQTACADIVSRGKTPLFVGGTGLYLRALLRGVFQGPSADWMIRNRLQETARSQGLDALHTELNRVDAASARRLHPNDERRIIRALEVYELTGKPLSEQQQQVARPVDQRPKNVFWLSPPRDWLHCRINDRVEQMLASGLIEEVRRLVRATQSLSHTARQALGYKEVIDWLTAVNLPDTDLAELNKTSISDSRVRELVQSIQTRTRQFAKRQETWFRNLEECIAIPIEGSESPDDIANAVLRMARG